ncbi:hypothetical protein GIB67_024272 [Kingdonia uniflora]|uniref:Plant-specific domain TIGR01615 family protein n=1 Tax=Kingdonia uniflora TaxID=39325 RepID=A0A7J7LZR8_9MAGN|nr:hypothetical protein GIB67_024272 [Kingdonia uniflora]
MIAPRPRDLWLNLGGDFVGGFSHESEHDLAVMVSDFLENGSSGTDSRCSSDSESGLSDLSYLSDKIWRNNHKVDQYERDMSSVVHSLIHSIKDSDLHSIKLGPCNISCIRFCLVKLLRLSGYDAAVCATKWQNCGKIPGGDHEYIDVIIHQDGGGSERLIIDIDFQSHFEIARAVRSYDGILSSLPEVYVGFLPKLKQFLQVMVEAARCSLKQNSMPLPPWRSYAYLQAKWVSTYQRKLNPDEHLHFIEETCSDHSQCIEHLNRIRSSLQHKIEGERILKPVSSDSKRRLKIERLRHSPVKNL